MGKKTIKSTTVGSAAVILIVSLVTSTASAQSIRNYDVSHGFWIQPIQPALVTVAITKDFEHAWAKKPGFTSSANWSPTTQPSRFNRYGTDWQNRNGSVWNSGTAGATRVLENINVGVGPWPFVRNNSVTATSGTNTATASSSIFINEFAPTGAFVGGIRSNGSVSVSGTGSAYAFSSAGVAMMGLTMDWRRGRLGWSPMFRDSVSGSAHAVGRPPRSRDPITFSITDDEGNVLLEDTLVDMWAQVDEGEDAEVLWQNGVLSLTNADAGELVIDLDSEFLDSTDRGFARLVFEGGIITESTDSGILDGILPAVGMSSTFTAPVSTDWEFDYQIPDLGTNIQFDFDNGSAPAPVPEPSTIGLLAISTMVLLIKKRR